MASGALVSVGRPSRASTVKQLSASPCFASSSSTSTPPSRLLSVVSCLPARRIVGIHNRLGHLPFGPGQDTNERRSRDPTTRARRGVGGWGCWAATGLRGEDRSHAEPLVGQRSASAASTARPALSQTWPPPRASPRRTCCPWASPWCGRRAWRASTGASPYPPSRSLRASAPQGMQAGDHLLKPPSCPTPFFFFLLLCSRGSRAAALLLLDPSWLACRPVPFPAAPPPPT